jgi:hypothetical protein
LYELTYEEKEAIKTNEFEFIRKKMPTNYEIYQIPRVIYDLFYLLFYSLSLDNRTTIFQFNDFQHIDYSEYCLKVMEYHNSDNFLDIIVKLNSFILDKLIEYKINIDSHESNKWYSIIEIILNKIRYLNNLTCSYNGIRKEIFAKYKELFEEIIVKISSNIEISSNISKIRRTTFLDKIIESILNEKKTGKIYHTFLYEILYEIFRQLSKNNQSLEYYLNKLRNDELIISIINNTAILNRGIEYLIYKNNYTDILYMGLYIELKNINKIILYRGSNNNIESAVNLGNDSKGYSISYNTSLLNAMVSDIDACTYWYMTFWSTSVNTFYLLDKYFYGDDSINDKLFFIPPLYPLMQLNSIGEFWHARSKIFKNSKIKSVKSFGLLSYKNENKFPNFLSSKLGKNNMDKTFRTMINKDRKLISNGNNS